MTKFSQIICSILYLLASASFIAYCFKQDFSWLLAGALLLLVASIMTIAVNKSALKKQKKNF